MEQQEQSKEIMFIQDKQCAFGIETGYSENEDQYTRTVKITKGELKAGEVFTIILHPFDIFEYGLISNQN